MKNGGRLGSVLLALCLLLCGCACGAAQREGAASAAEAVGRAARPAPTPAPAREVAVGSVPRTTPEPTPAPTPTPAPEALLLQSMTLEEKVGQLFFVRCPETDGAAMVAQYQPGGILLFGRDFEGLSREQAAETIAAYQREAKIGLLVGVDEEGGDVVRASDNPRLSEAPYRSMRALYAEGGTPLLCAAEAEKCRMLRGLGVNVNFAPVCDISDDPAAFMYARSLGLPPAETAAAIGEVVATYEAENVGTVLKHFPGYGNAADSHAGVVYDDRDLAAFEDGAFLPFKAGIDAGADCVLVTHNIVPCVDGEAPASLSAAWHAVLRDTLGFAGVIITDDLSMGGVTDYTDGASSAVAAVLAGNDMLCCTDFETQIPAVLRAVEDGTISEARIDESVLRILRWKLERGIITAQTE